MLSPIFSEVHFTWVAPTSPAPVGSTANPLPPRPESTYTMPDPYAGDEASPAALHHQSRRPSAGSKLWSASSLFPPPDAITMTCVLPLTSMRSGVEWPNPVFGSFVSHFTWPSALENATSRESAAFAIAQRKRTASPNSTGLLPIVTSNVWGRISCRHAIFPSRSSDAMTEEP
jgi:hypothetical protein